MSKKSKSKKSVNTSQAFTNAEVSLRSPGRYEDLTWEDIDTFLDAELLRLQKTRGWDLRPVLFKVDGRGALTSTLLPRDMSFERKLAQTPVAPSTKAVILYSEGWRTFLNLDTGKLAGKVEVRGLCWVDTDGRRIFKEVGRGEYESRVASVAGTFSGTLASLFSSEAMDVWRDVKRRIFSRDANAALANGGAELASFKASLRSQVRTQMLDGHTFEKFRNTLIGAAKYAGCGVDLSLKVASNAVRRDLPETSPEQLRVLLSALLPDLDADEIIEKQLS